MAEDKAAAPSDDQVALPLDISSYDTYGFCLDYPLARHKFEVEANAGSHEARLDWAKYVGLTDQFGGCNPINGNFTAVVLPLCRPERLRLVAYVLEYAFLYDNIIETDIVDENARNSGNSVLGHADWQPLNPALKRQQMQAKMVLELTTTDKKCAERVMDVWKTMISTTLRDKEKHFSSLEEYVDFRIVDTGAPFVESMMLFGMGMTLAKEEDAELKDIVYPCYAALGLANDYFSFDREYSELQKSGAKSLTNAVWLYMQWHDVDVPTARSMVREATNKYEKQFQSMSEMFRSTHTPLSDKLDRYLRALAYQISGNVVWSLNCPRYHPEHRYDPNAGLEHSLTFKSLDDPTYPVKGNLNSAESMPSEHGLDFRLSAEYLRKSSLTDSIVSTVETTGSSIEDGGITSSISSRSTSPELDTSAFDEHSKHVELDPSLVQAPFSYVSSMPSKGLRGAFIDALNIWLEVPEESIEHIKWMINHLHTASLMLDDIQDGSDLRRGKPAAHAVFDVAQTINSANLAIIEAINGARKMQQPEALDIVLDELQILHIGQGYDLYWTRHGTCPTEDEYLEMVSNKTGGLFRLLSRLMMVDRHQAGFRDDLDQLIYLVGQYFQIRDDYQNLQSAEYSAQKGFCEDLDEGKFSFPLVHCLNQRHKKTELHEILRTRQDSGFLSKELKLLVLEQLQQSGSFQYTRQTLKRLQGQIEARIYKIEQSTDRKNWVLRLFLQKLSV